MSKYKSSVGYFEYAICELLASLDRRLNLALDDWHIGEGFGIEWEDEDREHRTVDIHPSNWPRGTTIFAKFEYVKDGKSPGWHANHCVIKVDHIPELKQGLSLMCHYRGQCRDYRFLGERPEDIKLLKSLPNGSVPTGSHYD